MVSITIPVEVTVAQRRDAFTLSVTIRSAVGTEFIAVSFQVGFVFEATNIFCDAGWPHLIQSHRQYHGAIALSHCSCCHMSAASIHPVDCEADNRVPDDVVLFQPTANQSRGRR